MTPHDLQAVMRLESETPEAPHWSRAIYERFLSADPARKRIFIAEEGGRLLGFVAGQLILDACELDSILVDIAVRRSGVGRVLLAAFLEWATAGHAIRVQLEVRSGNERAVEFYVRSGFAQDGLRPGYYRNPEEDAVLMSRSLEPTPGR